MPSLVFLCFFPAALTYAGVARFRKWAERRQILDLPNERSSHLRPTPLGAGLVMAIVVLLLSAIWARSLSLGRVYIFYASGALMVAIVSWFDDLRPLPNLFRFTIHILAAIVAISGLGFWHDLNLPFLGSLSLGKWGFAATLVWIVGLINAYNFMDGTDGIAAGQALIAGLGWALLGWRSECDFTTGIGLLVAGSSLGFLIHNWPPARIFMGDVGSAFLGYTLAALPLIYNCEGKSRPGSPIVGLLLVWPFVFDTAFTFMNRLLKRCNVFSAHRMHLYQRMSSARSGHAKVALVYSGMTVLGCILARVWSTRVADGNVRSLLALPVPCIGLWIMAVAYERRTSLARHGR